MFIKAFIEIFFSIGLFINAMLFVPQAIKLYRTKNAQGLSFTTFAGFNLIQLFTVLHGYLHHDLILLIGALLSLVTCGLVTFLIVFYRRDNQLKSLD